MTCQEEMGCGASKPPGTSPPAASKSPPAEADRIFQLKHCGVRAVSGWYHRAGTANGSPKYKHETNDIWVRVNTNKSRWIVVPTDADEGNICIYHCKIDKMSPTLPPGGICTAWQLGSNWSKRRAEQDNWVAAFEKASKKSRWPAPNSPTSLTQYKEAVAATEGSVSLAGAGYAAVNGTYYRDGAANGAPRYKHATHPLWLRHNNVGSAWTVTVKGGSSSWTCIYKCEVSKKSPHNPPAKGWKLGENWSLDRAAKDGWADSFRHVQTRQPPPSMCIIGDNSAAPIVDAVLIGEVIDVGDVLDDDDDDDAAAPEVGLLIDQRTSSLSADFPPLAEMAARVKAELGIAEDTNLQEAMMQACEELGVDAAELSLPRQAEACYEMLFSMS